MRILYLGDDTPHTTSVHRANALRRLGHDVLHVNPQIAPMRLRIVRAMGTRVGLWPVAPWVSRIVERAIEGRSFNIAWIDGGAALAPSFHRMLKRRGIGIINYNIDDPFGSRDGRKWDLYRRSVRYHDLTVVVRKENIAEAAEHGARKVVRVYRSFDPVEHKPLQLSPAERRTWSSEVSFIGTWMPERGPFMARLLELGVPLSIRGNRWKKAPEGPRIGSACKSAAVCGKDFVAATQGSKVSIGLVSKENRDQHTTRSAEIPAIGASVFLAERTDEHCAMFREGAEAEFFSSAEECAQKCQRLLEDESRRGSIAAAAKRRIAELGLSNDSILDAVLKAADAPIGAQSPCWGLEVHTAHESSGDSIPRSRGHHAELANRVLGPRG